MDIVLLDKLLSKLHKLGWEHGICYYDVLGRYHTKYWVAKCEKALELVDGIPIYAAEFPYDITKLTDEELQVMKELQRVLKSN